jgi:peptide/nickel transport system substrate-binding protein
VPIGSFYATGTPGHVDLIAVNAFNPERARALLKEAGDPTPLELTMKLPPTAYARQGGEVIAHVKPLGFGNFARPGYYWNFESAKFNELWARIIATADPALRNRLLGEAQRLVADDAVAAYLYQPTWITWHALG